MITGKFKTEQLTKTLFLLLQKMKKKIMPLFSMCTDFVQPLTKVCLETCKKHAVQNKKGERKRERERERERPENVSQA